MSPPVAPKHVFFAYSSSPALQAETLREAVVAAERQGLKATGWESLHVGGKVMIDEITRAIDAADACVAEISTMNANVLFEAGYALARGKHLYLALDESDQEATRAWSGLALVDSIGRLQYSGNSGRLASQLVAELTNADAPLIDSLLASGRPKEANAVFALPVPHKFNAAERLERLLERKTDLTLVASQDDLALAGLGYYSQEIYRCSAAIFHFMAPRLHRAAEYNARLSLLAGLAHGLEIPLLMVAEESYDAPLDYRDLLYHYTSAAKLTDKVDEWLATLPTPKESKKRLGRLNLDIELPIRSFGQFVAESERDTLGDYFVQTNEFEAVLSGRAHVFTGRKGTGKSASMLQAVSDLREDRRILVVPVKPSSYDLAALIDVMRRFEESAKREYFLLQLWTYLLYTEMAIRTISHAESTPAGLGGDENLQQLADAMDELQIDRASDLAVRLDDALAPLLDESVDLTAAGEKLRRMHSAQLQPPLRRTLHNYDRVALLIDNLD